MTSADEEDSCSWTEYLLETIIKFSHDLASLLSTTFDLSSFGSTGSIVDNNETKQKLSVFLNEFIGLLAFDEFQLQLLKVFLLTFVSTVALIFIAWHMYGPRISQQFMGDTSSVPEDFDSSSGE